MGLFSNPLGYAGYPPGVQAPSTVVNSTVRAAKSSEVTAGTRDDVYISPKTKTSIVLADFASPPVLGFGSTIARPVNSTTLNVSGSASFAEGANIALGTVTGTKFGTSATQKMGFFNATPVIRQNQAAITNNVSVGGTTGTVANYGDLSVYSNDAAAIRNNIYQLALGLKGCISALRAYGLLG